DRGGKTRRSGADDDHVVNLVRIDRSDEANAPGKLDLARIAQQFSVGTDDDRQFAGRDVEALDQRLSTRIGLRVQKLVRMPVSGKESFEPQHVAVVGAADDYRPACTRLDQANAAQNKGAHDALAQSGLSHQKLP